MNTEENYSDGRIRFEHEIRHERDMERKQKILSDQLKIDYPDIPFYVLERDTSGWSSTNDGLIHFVHRQTKAVYSWHQRDNKWSIQGQSVPCVTTKICNKDHPPISNEIAAITNYILRDTVITPETKKQLLDYQRSLSGKPNVVGKHKMYNGDILQPFSIQPQNQHFQ